MARPTDRATFKREAERTFPIKVDVRVPGYGEPWPFAEMLAWCHEHIAKGAWDQHGHSERRKGDAPLDFARFYFLNEADAAAFDRQWLNGAAAADLGEEWHCLDEVPPRMDVNNWCRRPLWNKMDERCLSAKKVAAALEVVGRLVIGFRLG
jgi:hypothetical protein